MAPLRDFERTNAKLWDESTITGSTVADPSEERENTSPANNIARPPLPQQQPRPQQSPPAPPPNFRASSPKLSPSKQQGTQAPPRAGFSRPASRADSPRQNGGFARADGQVKRSGFARPEGLVTTRKEITKVVQAQKEQIAQRYITEPHDEVQIVAAGWFQWPSKQSTPTQAFGNSNRLEDLDHIRSTYKVWIRWDANLQALHITSARNENARDNVIAAVSAIRRAYEHAKARKISASPLFIVTPPSISVMKSRVKPNKTDEGLVTMELTGRSLTQTQLRNWGTRRKSLLEADLKRFKEHLVSHLLALAPMKGRMRMRVHFGHYNMSRYPQEFADGDCDFDGFVKVLGNPRAQATALFDKKLPADNIPNLLQQIAKDTPRFCTLLGDTWGLEEVKYQHALVFFFQTAQKVSVRVESDIDATHEGCYQLGASRNYRDNSRNKFIEVISVDVEKQVDWALEVVTDTTIQDQEIDPSWRQLAEGSISPNTRGRKDKLGLTYPGMTPHRHYSNIKVGTTVLRSILKYKLTESDYILEIGIYRSWPGNNTEGGPLIQASVSMYHAFWDSEMESLEGTTYNRAWDSKLTQFFNIGKEHTHGFEGFLREIQGIKDLLRGLIVEE
ncbi:hypothetical protein B0J14DRAFT_559656 [Halenospora varia]|nr:hypothetical protein B0J14DRAFT_559656 [Halenospora varia]